MKLKVGDIFKFKPGKVSSDWINKRIKLINVDSSGVCQGLLLEDVSISWKKGMKPNLGNIRFDDIILNNRKCNLPKWF